MSAAAPARPEIASPKRKQILHAAADLFIAQGYGAVSMDAIARAAGVSKATLYAHFVSKDRLFATIIREACQENFDWPSMLQGIAREPRAALLAMGERMLRFKLDPGVLAIYRVVIAESGRFPELGRAFYENGPANARRHLGEWIRRQSEAGQLRVQDPEIAADQWMALLTGILHFRSILGIVPAPTEAEIKASVQSAADVFLAAYGTK